MVQMFKKEDPEKNCALHSVPAYFLPLSNSSLLLSMFVVVVVDVVVVVVVIQVQKGVSGVKPLLVKLRRLDFCSSPSSSPIWWSWYHDKDLIEARFAIVVRESNDKVAMHCDKNLPLLVWVFEFWGRLGDFPYVILQWAVVGNLEHIKISYLYLSLC